MTDAKVELVAAVREFLKNGVRVTQRGDEFLTQVIERKDKSDPHYKLCEALERYDATLEQSDAVMGEAKHDGRPIGVHGYECSQCGKGTDEMLADPVCTPIAPVQDDDAELIEALTNIARAMKYGPDQAWIEQAIDRLSRQAGG